jgi:uncharacterized protein
MLRLYLWLQPLALSTYSLLMVHPTLTHRIKTLDVLRGVAILGILLANIAAFSSPFASQIFSPNMGIERPDWVQNLGAVFVTGKFRSMLAVLFGIGIWLQFQKREPQWLAEQPRDFKRWPGGYLKRCLWLAAFGLVHGYLIWYGDILFLYSGLAMLTATMVRLKSNVLWWIAGSLGVVALGISALTAVMAIFGASDSPGAMPIRFFNPQEELRVYQSGTWPEQLLFRSVYTTIMVLMAAFMGAVILPLFILGVQLGRMGALKAPSSVPKVRNTMLLVGFGVGLPLNLIPLLSPDHFGTLRQSTELFAGPILALGYLMLVAIVVEKKLFEPITAVFERVGRVALSVYLMQSIVCTFIFYSWGLGLFGRLDPIGQLGVVGMVWMLNIAFAYGWLAVFRMGPFEWLWRSLTESKVLPIRKTVLSDAVASDVPPPVVAPQAVGDREAVDHT